MLLGEIEASFPWGVLLVTDDSSTEQIPQWTSEQEQVTHAKTALVVRVLHQGEGSVQVRVWNTSGDVRGRLTFSGIIDVASGVLRVSDALGDEVLRLPVAVGPHSVEIYADSLQEASEVHVVLDPATEPLG